MVDWKDHVKLIRYCIGRLYQRQEVVSHYQDLESVGMVSLHKACERFEESKGFKFSTFACKVIGRDMVTYLRQETRAKFINRTVSNDGWNHLDTCLETTQRDHVYRDEVEKFLRAIGDRERDMIIDRFFYSKKLEDIGNKHNLSKERVRQIIKKTLEQGREIADIGCLSETPCRTPKDSTEYPTFC